MKYSALAGGKRFRPILTYTVSSLYDKEIERTTLGNDGTTDNLGNQILLDFKTLGETLFRGKSSVVDGEFDFDLSSPRFSPDQ